MAGGEEAYGYGRRLEYVTDYWRERYERENGRNWDRFYKSARPKGFLASTTARDYLAPALHDAFRRLSAAEASQPPPLLLEVGCGAGHAIAPLLAAHPTLRVCALDVAPRALQTLRANAALPQDRVETALCDVEASDAPLPVAAGAADVALLVFVLSSCTPARHAAVAAKVARALAPAGRGLLLFRDYARGDANQRDFDAIHPPRKISPNFYVRSDGTRAYFFEHQEVVKLFCDAGLVCEECTVVRIDKPSGNPRLFIQGKFRTSAESNSSSAPSS